jgi:diacylglycerol kinase family enzyme
MSYIWAGLQTLARPLHPVEVRDEQGALQGCGTAVLVGNGRFYGGPFPVFPRARLDDGLLDVCVFERHRYRDMIRYGQGVMRGAHTTFSDVRYFQARAVECRPRDDAAPYQLDGESVGTGMVKFAVLPKALRVIAPLSA